MKKFFTAFVSAILLSLQAQVFADVYSDFANYKSGDSLAWFYELRAYSLKKSNSDAVEEKILGILNGKDISDAAFERAAEILKPIASDKSVPVLAKFLNSDFRAPWVCDVFLGIDSSSVDDTLAESLGSAGKIPTIAAISTLAQRGEGFKKIVPYADSSDAEIATAAIYAIGYFADAAAVEKLSEIAARKDARENAAFAVLSSIAYRAAVSGDKSLALGALKAVPSDYSASVVARGILAGKDAGKYFDSLIIAGKPAEAGRAISGKRKFEDSAEIIKAFPTLSKAGQLAAMGSFMTSGDTRFYPSVAPLLDSPDADLRAEAVYVARFICTDEANLAKIYALISGEDKNIAGLARNVLEENASFAAVKVLKGKEAAGDVEALAILVKRGDLDARDRLVKRYADGGYKDPKVSRAVEETIAFGEMKALASHMKSGSDELRKDIAKIIMKRLAQNRDKMFTNEAGYDILDGNLDPSDPLYKFMESKLKAKFAKHKDVWQSEFRERAVEDKLIKAATEPEPKLDGLVPLFDGKTLNGWKTSTGSAKYSVADGCILGEIDPKMKANSFLITERSDYKDFIFTCEFKWVDIGNSGVIFKGYFNGDGKVVGPQAEIDDNPNRRWTGGIYEEGSLWKYSVSRADQDAARYAINPNGWNRLTVKVDGDRIQTWLNGVPVSDLVWEGVKPGFFGLQIHQGKSCSVLWRNIGVKELNK